MVSRPETTQDVWKILEQVSDPEIPVLSIVEMKIVSRVEITSDGVEVEIVPTFAGCPAIDHIKEQVRIKLLAAGFERVTVKTDVRTSWSTDDLEETTRQKLRAFGIAPPSLKEDSLLRTLTKPVPCPFCQSVNTVCDGPFGATLCKQPYYCNACKQSFDRFKPL